MAFALAVALALAGLSENLSRDLWYGLPDLFPKLNSAIYLLCGALIFLGARFASAILAAQFACAEILALMSFGEDLNSGLLYLIILAVWFMKLGVFILLLAAGIKDAREYLHPEKLQAKYPQILKWLTIAAIALAFWNIWYQWSTLG